MVRRIQISTESPLEVAREKQDFASSTARRLLIVLAERDDVEN
jgi:hypothetical protein